MTREKFQKVVEEAMAGSRKIKVIFNKEVVLLDVANFLSLKEYNYIDIEDKKIYCRLLDVLASQSWNYFMPDRAITITLTRLIIPHSIGLESFIMRSHIFQSAEMVD